MVARGQHLALAAEPCINDHALYGLAALGQGLVDRAFELDAVAAAPAAVGGNHELRTGVFDAILDGIGGKAAEYYGMHGADARAGMHCNHRLGDQGHVDDDAIALFDAL